MPRLRHRPNRTGAPVGSGPWGRYSRIIFAVTNHQGRGGARREFPRWPRPTDPALTSCASLGCRPLGSGLHESQRSGELLASGPAAQRRLTRFSAGCQDGPLSGESPPAPGLTSTMSCSRGSRSLREHPRPKKRQGGRSALPGVVPGLVATVSSGS